MMNVLRGNDVSVTWTITKCDDSPEDFTGADLFVFAVNGYGKIPVAFTIGGSVLSVNIPGNKLDVGNYSLEAIWSKNNSKNWGRVLKKDVFSVTNNPEAVNSVCK